MVAIAKRGENWYCQLRYKHKHLYFTFSPVSETEARGKAAKVDHLLQLLK